jgi:hypothetical protein
MQIAALYIGKNVNKPNWKNEVAAFFNAGKMLLFIPFSHNVFSSLKSLPHIKRQLHHMIFIKQPFLKV